MGSMWLFCAEGGMAGVTKCSPVILPVFGACSVPTEETCSLAPQLHLRVSMSNDLSLSIRTTLGFKDCLDFLKQSLFRTEFQIIAEIPFHRTFQRHFGLSSDAYVVLIVWVPFQAFRALLSDRDAGVFNPFPIVVADGGKVTTVVAPNHEFLRSNASSVAIQLLGRDLNRRMRQVFAELAAQEKLLKNQKLNEDRKGQGTLRAPELSSAE